MTQVLAKIKAIVAAIMLAIEALLPLPPTDAALANLGSANEFCPKPKGVN